MFSINLWIALRVTNFYKFNVVSIEVAVFIDSPKRRSTKARQHFIGREDMENGERKTKHLRSTFLFAIAAAAVFVCVVTVASVAVFPQSICHAHLL